MYGYTKRSKKYIKNVNGLCLIYVVKYEFMLTLSITIQTEKNIKIQFIYSYKYEFHWRY